MGSWILASSRIDVGTQRTSCALVIESPLANSVTSCPKRTNSSVRYETIRSVPPYNFGGTLSQSGDTCAIFMAHSPFVLSRCPVLTTVDRLLEHKNVCVIRCKRQAVCEESQRTRIRAKMIMIPSCLQP